ncbi:hypothetical protein AMELA_G00176340 [Ameiurus melas]|uniref:Uncharacterized protein n=1 Tax=Ameiurus melas TaxID=219545 RepID=A0A7J6ADD0_AMEME|nr:hypothetical protein AMELA_G00176340 [Ameiurus melas]
MSDFPKPFEQYQNHVALRTPFSFLLELLTYYGQSNEENVKRELSEILDDCEKSGDEYTLISIVMCVCERGESRQYGACLSCGSDIAKNIMTAVSCLHVWHPKVSSAVMSMFPDDAGEPHSIKLPDTVRCRAYAMEKLEELKPPCKRCNQLYSLPDPTDHLNTPGTCAETEAISNLLRAEEGVSDQCEITQNMENYFKTNMQKLRKTNNRDYKIDRVYFPN